MRIGELSQRTGASRRLLRYYEEQGLLVSTRESNGYRDFDERYVDRVVQIRGLLDAGLPLRIIKQMLPCLIAPRALYFEEATPEMLATLEEHQERMTQRLQNLERDRNAVAAYVAEVRSRQLRRLDRPSTADLG